MVRFRCITTTTTTTTTTTNSTTTIELSLGGSSPYTSTYKTNKNKLYMNELVQ